jgi:hypothetical protein
MSVIEKIEALAFVDCISDEREWERKPAWAESNGDGFWIYFKPGFFDPMEGLHSAHEDTPSECWPILRRVERCPLSCECRD